MKNEEKTNGTLYLIPSTLGAEDIDYEIPAANLSIIAELDEFIVENIKTARRFLRRLKYKHDFEDVTFHVLNKKTPLEETITFLAGMKNGKNCGLLSEAGNPCIADPGQIIVAQAHENQIKVVPLVGPNSILLALIASGFNGQNFTFHGYLPIETAERIEKIKELEKISTSKRQTQIFMETPYRNNSLLKDIIKTCKKNTYLCIASDITKKTEFIKTMRIEKWKKQIPDLNKKPTIFLIHS